MKIKGVISDMDGVILDTEKLYVRFWCEAANFCGYPMKTHHALSIRSLARPFAIEKLKGFFGEDFDYQLLIWLKNNGYKVALATATAPERTEKYLSRLGLYQYFDKIICASMVSKGKPEPDIYIKAAEELGLKPEECLALEDSQNGIKSASSACCKTVMVPDLDQPTKETLPLLYAVADGLLDVEKILNSYR